MLIHRIEGDKELNFSSSKAMLLSNDGDLLKETVRCMGERAGAVEVAVRRLGYDYTVSAKSIKACKGKIFDGQAQKEVQEDYDAENQKHEASKGVLCGCFARSSVWSGVVGSERQCQEPA